MTDRLGRLLPDHLTPAPAPVGSNHRMTERERKMAKILSGLDQLVRKSLANNVAVFVLLEGSKSGYIRSEDPVKGFLVIGSGRTKSYTIFDDMQQKATMDAGRVYIQPRWQWNACREIALDAPVVSE